MFSLPPFFVFPILTITIHYYIYIYITHLVFAFVKQNGEMGFNFETSKKRTLQSSTT